MAPPPCVVVHSIGASAFLVISNVGHQEKKKKEEAEITKISYLPKRCHSNIYLLTSHALFEVAYIPLLDCGPFSCSSADYEWSVASYVAHELQRAGRLFVQRGYFVAVEGLVGLEESGVGLHFLEGALVRLSDLQ